MNGAGKKKNNISAPVLYNQLMSCGAQSIQDAGEWLRVSSSHHDSACKMQIALNLRLLKGRSACGINIAETAEDLFSANVEFTF